MGQIVGDTTGRTNLEALMAGISKGTGETYVMGWENWPQYCMMKGISPWVAVCKPGWGGKIRDFVTYAHYVVGLGPSAVNGGFTP